MKKIAAAALIAVCLVPSGARADERVGDAAIGAVSGALVLGPVGAVAGAAVGYVAGPSIARSFGLRSEPQHRNAAVKSSGKAAARRGPPAGVKKAAAEVTNSTGPQRPAAEIPRKDVASSPAKPAAAPDDAKSREWESLCTNDCGSPLQY